MANTPSSELNIVATVAVVLSKLLIALQDEVTNLKVVYDEKLSYESSVRQFRANNGLDARDQSLFPLFAFKRSVMRHSKDGPGRRVVSMRETFKQPPTNVRVYRSVHGEIDVNFLYITKSMMELEQFEIAYLSEEGFPNTKVLDLQIPELGTDPLKYYVTYGGELTDRVVESDGVYYKAVSGTMTVRGYYPVLIGVLPAITQVVGNIYGRNSELLFSTVVSAP